MKFHAVVIVHSNSARSQGPNCPCGRGVKYRTVRYLGVIVSARRNQTRTERAYYLGSRYNREKLPEHTGKKRGGAQNEHHFKTAELIAKEERVGQATVRRAAKFAAHIDSMGRAFDWLKWSPRSNIAPCDIWPRVSVRRFGGGLRQPLEIRRGAIGSGVQGVR